MIQSIMDGQLVISSNIGFYLFKIRIDVKKIEENKEKEELEDEDEQWKENDSVYNRIYS